MDNNNNLDKLAVLLGNLIEKYADRLDLDSLPDPIDPKKEEDIPQRPAV